MKAALGILVFITSPSWALNLRVEFTDLASEEGSLKYVLFNQADGFPSKSENGLRQGSISAQKSKEGLILKNLEAGEYALAVIHDENDNSQLDTNFLGIPKEGFGFSNNPKIFFGPPDFEEASFSLSEDTTIKLKMKGL